MSNHLTHIDSYCISIYVYLIIAPSELEVAIDQALHPKRCQLLIVSAVCVDSKVECDQRVHSVRMAGHEVPKLRDFVEFRQVQSGSFKLLSQKAILND